MSDVTHSAVLMAGGQSRRMGQDKALLPVDGQPLWRRQLAVLKATNPECTYLSVAAGSSLAAPGVERIEDHVPDAGPLAGLDAVLQALTEPLLLVLAVDLPRMTSGYLQALLDASMPGCGCVPTIAGRAEPLAAVYPREIVGVVAARLVNRDLSLRGLVEECLDLGLVTHMPVVDEDRPAFTNVNEPSDW